MNKFHIHYNKVKSFFFKKFLWLLGITGFGFLISCSKYPDDPIAMYGIIVPDQNINFKGRILSQDSLKPIPNIQVKLTSGYLDTAYTTSDINGNYSLWKYAYEDQTVKMILVDRDSTMNGEFHKKTVDIVVSFRDVNNKEHYADIYLERK